MDWPNSIKLILLTALFVGWFFSVDTRFSLAVLLFPLNHLSLTHVQSDPKTMQQIFKWKIISFFSVNLVEILHASTVEYRFNDIVKSNFARFYNFLGDIHLTLYLFYVFFSWTEVVKKAINITVMNAACLFSGLSLLVHGRRNL